MRIPQPDGEKGSLKWIQRLLAHQPHLLDDTLRAAGAWDDQVAIEWVSPRQEDDWAEYRDGAFLTQVGCSDLANALRDFWPQKGPQWDALGRDASGNHVVLVEAKSHISELASTCAASPASRHQIEQSLNATKATLGITSTADWTTGYYQYANRLAHLYFLRSHGVDAWLVFVYFLNDRTMDGPTLPTQWAEGLRMLYQHLGMVNDQKLPGVVNAYIDVQALI